MINDMENFQHGKNKILIRNQLIDKYLKMLI